MSNLSPCPKCKIPCSAIHKCISCGCNSHVISGCNFLIGAIEEHGAPVLCFECYNSGKSQNFEHYTQNIASNQSKKRTLVKQSSIASFCHPKLPLIEKEKSVCSENNSHFGNFLFFCLSV